VDEYRDAVYGVLYESASTQMQYIRKAIDQQRGIGFTNEAACAEWAKENYLDVICLGKTQHQFYFISHKGEMLNKKAWMDYYCKDLLFVRYEDEKGKEQKYPWYPQGFEYHDNAKIAGEIADGLRLPLYHRDYFTPTGYYDISTGTFNVAKPFPVHAKETGRDTSFIYQYIEHVAGECAPWLLAWLRAKMIHPREKTQVVPVIMSRAQGTGKTTIGEVICKGLYGKDNVLVTEQFDSQNRFNSDSADALIICIEEKEEQDRRNTAAAIKSRSTATQIRKEHKGVDPIYQESYTEYIMTTNKDVPVKFDDREEQRRFMIMEADQDFTRKTSDLANEVFTKLYGADANMNRTGVPFVDDTQLISQFKHELYTNEDIANVQLRDFPKTAAYNKCFNIPRTSENTEIDAILRSLAPFIRASLLENKMISQVIDEQTGQTLSLTNFVQTPGALQYIPEAARKPAMVAICRPIIFYDIQTNKPFQHSVVEKCIYDCSTWLSTDFGLTVVPDMSPLHGGFSQIQGRYRTAVAARFILKEDSFKIKNPYPVAGGIEDTSVPVVSINIPKRIGERLRVNGQWRPDINGEFETVNEMKPGVSSLENKNQNVQYMDTFLFESDSITKSIYLLEEKRLSLTSEATGIFIERLKIQRTEAEVLYRKGIVARVVYSGSKSYHMLVRVKDAPETLEQYKWLHAQLCTVLSTVLTFDETTCDPARLTRAPITFERISMYKGTKIHGVQKLILENWLNVYDYNWRPLYQQWLNRPLYEYEVTKGRRLMPTKSIYRDAMYSLLKGSFWLDMKWNGKRQQCFFPAYRLCRMLGFSHDELWSQGGIMDGIDEYYRKGEVQYWRERENSKIIKRIDDDVEEMIKELDKYEA
jgi:hypothetical protein